MNEQVDLEHSSQLVEEEQDFFLDDDSVDHEKELVLSQEKCKTVTAVDKEESFRHMLAGPSSNKVYEYIKLF